MKFQHLFFPFAIVLSSHLIGCSAIATRSAAPSNSQISEPPVVQVPAEDSPAVDLSPVVEPEEEEEPSSTPAMTQTPTPISSAHPLAIALEAAQQDGYVNEGTWQEYIEITHDSAEAPTNATVTITQTGFLDDSVKGHQFLVQLTKNESGDWQLIEIDKEWICYRGISENGLCL